MTWRLFSFPLLAKELTERAARPRTYGLRVLGALLLVLAFWALNQDTFTNGSISPSAILSAGYVMFQSLLKILFYGIYLFVPAMLCSVVTHEKERDSLTLLLLTELRPWQIVLQKYLGGLVPVLSMLMLALPLGAIAYGCGGFTVRELSFNLLLLTLATLQVGAIAVWCSCRFRTTVGAFLGTYLLGFAFYIGPFLLLALYHYLRGIPLPDSPDPAWVYLHVPAIAIERWRQYSVFEQLSPAIIACSILLFLWLATRALPHYATVASRPWLPRFFTWLDDLARKANRWFGSITFGNAATTLPTVQPLAWREKRARALARPEHLVRLLVVFEALVLLPCWLIPTHDATGHLHPDSDTNFTMLAMIAAGFAVLTISVSAANTFVTERVNQTLDVLLTTQFTAAEIVRQKAKALRGFTCVLALPILTVILHRYYYFDPGIRYLIVGVLSTAIVLPLLGWLGLWIGLFCRTRLRAIVTMLGLIVTWSIAPIIFFYFMPQNLGFNRYAEWWEAGFIQALSPLLVPIYNETGALYRLGLPSIVMYFVLMIILLVTLRIHCLMKADAYLRR